MKNIVIDVKGMSCAHCEMRVNKKVKSLNGVSDCKADAQTGKVNVSYEEGSITLDAIKEAIQDAGYDPV